MLEAYPARALLDAQGEILEQMADGATLQETLTRIANLVERLAPASLCSIALLQPDGKHLKAVAAPSLPEAYRAAIDGMEIGPCHGSCGTAAWRKEPVIVADTATDPLWEAHRELVLSLGLRTCWSLPILHSDGSVLGTIALHYREARAPAEQDWGLLAPCAKLIRLASAVNSKEHELRANETRWQIGAEATGLGTFDHDLVTGQDSWSPTFRQILGVPETAPPGLTLLLSLVHPDDRKRMLAKIAEQYRRSSGSAWRDEIRIFRADNGEERSLVIKGYIQCRADGRPLHVIGSISDITGRVRREKDLSEAKAAAEAANRAKSKFLASMSHELRTPLNAIIGFSDMIRNKVFGPVTPQRYESYIDDIYKSGTHLLSLINDVLDMAKIEAQKFELRRAPVNLASLAERALLLVRPQAQAKAVKLVTDFPAGLALFADERAMCQVLVNLLANAVKFTNPDGTVRLFGQRLPSGGMTLGVADTGSGMTPEGIAIALQPFGQAHMDIAAERSGTGLGLPIAKALFEGHGAIFHITSTLGVGTCVWGEFPARDVSENGATAQTGH